MPLGADRYPLGVVVPTRKMHKDMSTACPDAHGASEWIELFTLVRVLCVQERYGRVAREVHKIPYEQKLALVLDWRRVLPPPEQDKSNWASQREPFGLFVFLRALRGFTDHALSHPVAFDGESFMEEDRLHLRREVGPEQSSR